MTFSIVAHDPRTDELGGAVASRFFAVGALIPAIEPGVGAIATQALANGAYPSQAFPRLRAGAAPADVVAELTDADEGRSDRQLGIVTSNGVAAAFTGSDCMDAATHRTGPGYAIQGNLLVSETVIERMEEAFLAIGDLPLADRLLAALLAGDDAGGDRRGRQGAALSVRRSGDGLFGAPDLVCDLRVDDHPAAPRELARLLAIHTHYFVPAPDAELVPITGELATELRHLVAARGADPGRGPGYDEALRTALEQVVGVSNLEERWRGDARIDPVVLGVLRGEILPPDA